MRAGGTCARLEPAWNPFISRAREDQPPVERIVRGPAFGGGVRVRTDRMIGPGKDWRGKVKQALEASDVFALTRLAQPAFAERLPAELTGSSPQRSEQ